MTLTTGATMALQSYKHDRSLHRIWEEVTVLEDNDHAIIVANKRTKVIESNGRFWYTKEPSVAYFYKHHWFNVIGIIKPTGISFYCNLSSPILVDEEALKYIDYDLDIKVMPDFGYSILDQNEYRRHQKQMRYPKELCDILESELKYLREQIDTHADPFHHEIIIEKYRAYEKIGEK